MLCNGCLPAAPPLHLVCILFLYHIQAITGINSVVFYSTTIFGLAGFDEAIIGTSLVGVINVVTTIITSNLIDKYGRKVLLLTGTSVMYAHNIECLLYFFTFLYFLVVFCSK